MTLRIVKLPDVGEGVAEAELVEWHVSVGDTVTTETVLAEVMTDKATVEISAPVAGVITFLAGTPGDTLAIGSDFAGIETDGDPAPLAPDAPPSENRTAAATPQPAPSPRTPSNAGELPPPAPLRPTSSEPGALPPPIMSSPSPPSDPIIERDSGTHRPLAAPAVRQRAKDLGIDLAMVPGSGPDGRITHADLDRSGHPPTTSDATHTAPLIGMRRKIADRLTVAAAVPTITYVEEIDLTALEELRSTLNTRHTPKLTLLPFLVRAIVQAVVDQPQINATFNEAEGQLTTYEAAHIGIATQTPNGLVVPVVHHAGSLDLWACAMEISRISEAARSGTATRQELSGSTITITSLGALGGLATTPILNHPEVAIVGVNKMQVRPVWDGVQFAPRTMVNLSSSFDHRIVDGWDAATFIQRIKTLLETPALLFIEPGR
jgi:2-oxoisovalerate dehydrogenase E2 component (dihydrolipoyl transacylase)